MTDYTLEARMNEANNFIFSTADKTGANMLWSNYTDRINNGISEQESYDIMLDEMRAYAEQIEEPESILQEEDDGLDR